MSETILTGYKLLRLRPPYSTQDRISAFCDGRGVAYPKNGKVNRPFNCGPLGVFINKRSAENCRNDHAGPFRIIVKCRYKKSKDTKFWNSDRISAPLTLPRGTDFADWVECLE